MILSKTANLKKSWEPRKKTFCHGSLTREYLNVKFLNRMPQELQDFITTMDILKQWLENRKSSRKTNGSISPLKFPKVIATGWATLNYPGTSLAKKKSCSPCSK